MNIKLLINGYSMKLKSLHLKPYSPPCAASAIMASNLATSRV